MIRKWQYLLIPHDWIKVANDLYLACYSVMYYTSYNLLQAEILIKAFSKE